MAGHIHSSQLMHATISYTSHGPKRHTAKARADGKYWHVRRGQELRTPCRHFDAPAGATNAPT